jgi:hypothetical protein
MQQKKKYKSTFDEVVALSVTETNTTLGAAIGKGSFTIHHYRIRRSDPPVGIAFLLAELLNMDPVKLWADRKIKPR